MVVCNILKHIVTSAAEAETAALFHNGQAACPIRAPLEEIGHPQKETQIITDNEVATGFAHDNLKQKRSRAFDMRYYWIQDRENQKQFHIIWKSGDQNLADYHSKHHAPCHHQMVRPKYLHISEE